MIECTPTYIVASSKQWHKHRFDELASTIPGNWIWAETPEALLNAVHTAQPRYIFFPHWSWKVPHEVYSNYECVCFHMTNVPYGRGGSPLQNLIVAGHKETKLTALRMVQTMDSGPVYTQSHLALTGRAEDIYSRAGDISFEIMRWIIENEPQPIPQQGEVVNFKRRTPEQSELPKIGDLNSIYDHIRMLDAPTYPLAFVEYGDFRLEFSRADIGDDEVRALVSIRKRQAPQES